MTSILKADTIQDTDGNNIINENSNTITIGASGDTTNIIGTLQNNGAAVGGTNTPAFLATRSAVQSIANATATKVQFDTELFDTDNTYDNSTNYRFTPGVAGKYVITSMVKLQNCGTDKILYNSIYKNGSVLSPASSVQLSGRNDDHSNIVTVIDVANTTDYYHIEVYHDAGGSRDLLVNNTYFSGYKIIE